MFQRYFSCSDLVVRESESSYLIPLAQEGFLPLGESGKETHELEQSDEDNSVVRKMVDSFVAQQIVVSDEVWYGSGGFGTLRLRW